MTQGNVFVELAQDYVRIRNLFEKARELRSEEAWTDVLKEKSIWSTKTDDLFSVWNMTKKEMEQTLIEDLLLVYVEMRRGAKTSYRIDSVFRHVDFSLGDIRKRQDLYEAFHGIKNSHMVICEGDYISLNPDHLDEAMDFCGVYYTEEDILNPPDTVLDDIEMTGGVELIGDSIEEIVREL